jgi:hypothetical protein
LCVTILVQRGLYAMLEIETSTRPLSTISIRRRFLLLAAGLGILDSGAGSGPYPGSAIYLAGGRQPALDVRDARATVRVATNISILYHRNICHEF